MSRPIHLTAPAGVTALTLETPRGDFAGFDASPSGERVGRVVFVHGFTGGKHDYLALLGPCADAGYHARVYDQSGHHDSAGPADESGYSLEGFADDLIAVAASFGNPIHVVGHSFGGLVAQTAVQRSPGTFASMTLLCSGPGGMPDAAEDLEKFRQAMVVIGPEATYRADYEASVAAGLGAPAPHIADFMQQRFLASEPAVMTAIASMLVNTPDLVDRTAATKIPALVVYGEGDEAWDQGAQDDMAARLGAQRLVIPGAGHSPNVEAPEALVAILLGFWDEIPLGQKA